MSEKKLVSEEITSDSVINVRGLNCPLPLLRIKKEITKLASGQILQADGTDPGSRNDLPGWCHRVGHRYLGERMENGFISFFIQNK